MEIGIIKNGIVTKTKGTEGFIFKSEKAFKNKEGICYIPEMTGNNEELTQDLNDIQKTDKYTYADFLKLAGNNEEVAEMIFYGVTWEHPTTYLENVEYLEPCESCGYVNDTENALNDECEYCHSSLFSDCNTCGHYYDTDENPDYCPQCKNKICEKCENAYHKDEHCICEKSN